MNPVAPLVMTFSASDPTSGAGMQADALTIAALGAHPLTILTGLTAQNTVGVEWFEPLVEDAIGRQLNTLLVDVGAWVPSKRACLEVLARCRCWPGF